MFSPAQNELGLLEYMAWVRNGRKAGDPRLLSAETRLREAVEAGKNDKPRILNLATVLLSSGKIRDAEALLEAHVDAELEALGTSWEGRLSDLSTRLLSLSLQPILRRASEGAGGGSSPSASLLAIRAAACLLLAEETGAADVEGTVGTRARSLLESVLLAAGEPEAAYLLVKGGSREEKGRLPEIRRAVRRRMGRTKAERREVLTGLEGETGLGAGEDRGLLVLFGSKERSAAALERITRNTRLALAARKRGYREEAVAALSRAREALGLDTIAVAAGPP
jgi:hypothetical protein